MYKKHLFFILIIYIIKYINTFLLNSKNISLIYLQANYFKRFNYIYKKIKVSKKIYKLNEINQNNLQKVIKKNEFHDRCIITIKAGNGGNGNCSFITYSQKKNKKYASGGKGGNGGNVYLIGNEKIDNYFNLKLNCSYYAENGQNGESNNKNGHNGKDIYINVPINTIIYEEKKFINFIYLNNQTVLIGKGGRGGKGNYSFRTKFLKIPFVSQYGEKTKEKKIFLKRIFFVDLSIIGYPNVGKSTLLNKITNANIKIANYSYTSKFPNLGIMDVSEEKKHLKYSKELEEKNVLINNEIKEKENYISKNYIEHQKYKNKENIYEEETENNEREYEICEQNNEDLNLENDEVLKKKKKIMIIDFPGIIENLDEKKKNISYKYLEHLKYSKILIYMLDINDERMIEIYENIKKVLINYDECFKNKKEFILLNKIDLYNKKINISSLISDLKSKLQTEHIYPISALTEENVDNVMKEIIFHINDKNILKEFIQSLPTPMDINKIENTNFYLPYDYKIYKYNNNIYIIKGKYLENQVQLFNFTQTDSLKVFMKILNDLGINQKLKQMGIMEGDKIIIGDFSFDFSFDFPLNIKKDKFNMKF